MYRWLVVVNNGRVLASFNPWARGAAQQKLLSAEDVFGRMSCRILTLVRGRAPHVGEIVA